MEWVHFKTFTKNSDKFNRGNFLEHNRAIHAQKQLKNAENNYYQNEFIFIGLFF